MQRKRQIAIIFTLWPQRDTTPKKKIFDNSVMRIKKRNMAELKRMKKNGSNASSAQLSDDNGAEVLYFGSEEQGNEKVDKLLFGKLYVTTFNA